MDENNPHILDGITNLELELDGFKFFREVGENWIKFSYKGLNKEQDFWIRGVIQKGFPISVVESLIGKRLYPEDPWSLDIQTDPKLGKYAGHPCSYEYESGIDKNKYISLGGVGSSLLTERRFLEAILVRGLGGMINESKDASFIMKYNKLLDNYEQRDPNKHPENFVDFYGQNTL